MNIAFDFHGVIEKYPDIMKPFMQSIRHIMWVIVLSGPPEEQIKKELNDAGYTQGVHYDLIISVVDWIKSQGIEMNLNKNGSWYCDDDIWWASKAKICKEKNISILIDDKLEYKEHIKDEFPLFFHVD